MTPWTRHARLPCPSPTPGTCSHICPLSQSCCPKISSSVSPSPPAFNLPSVRVFSKESVLRIGGQSIGASDANVETWAELCGQWEAVYDQRYLGKAMANVVSFLASLICQPFTNLKALSITAIQPSLFFMVSYHAVTEPGLSCPNTQ